MVYNLSDTTVLRFSLLSDIHAADNLDTCNKSAEENQLISGSFIEHTVDSETDTNLTLECLNMNIGSSLTNSLLDHLLDDLNDGRISNVLIML